MLKKMRWRFIGSAMAAFTAVILVLLCVVNLWNARSIAHQQDDTLRGLLSVADHGQEPAPDPSGQPKPPLDSPEHFSPEVNYMIRFFSVSFDADGTVQQVDQDYIASITEDEAEEYAAQVLSSGRQHGYYAGYRYLVDKTDNGTTVFFLNSERELHTIRSLLAITVTIAVFCIAGVFLLVVLFSRRAIAPYLRNLESQKQFITNAGHELKTPITAIAASADVLAMEHPDDEWVSSIQSQTARLSKLVTSLVTLSRLDEENPFPARAEFSISDVLWELWEPFSSLAQAKGKHFSQEIEDDLTFTGDRTAVQQMVSILLDNAVKYSTPGGNISLSARRSGKRIEITVSNSCDHAGEIDTARLFDRFYRADASHSSAVSGTGIGLSIARATAEAHGGSITAETAPDSITFRIRL